MSHAHMPHLYQTILFIFKKGPQIDLHPVHEFYTVIVNEKLY